MESETAADCRARYKSFRLLLAHRRAVRTKRRQRLDGLQNTAAVSNNRIILKGFAWTGAQQCPHKGAQTRAPNCGGERNMQSLRPMTGRRLARLMSALMAALLACAVVLAGSVPASTLASSGPWPAKLGSTGAHSGATPFDGARALEHVRVLSEDIGPRVAGTPGELAGADYIAAQLESWGYDVELERFAVSSQRLATVTLDNGDAWQMRAAANGAITGDAVVSGEVVWAGTGQSAADFPDDITGKIVLMRYGSSSSQRNAQVANAVSRGAAAIILFNESTGTYKSGTFSPSFSPAVAIPVLGGGQAHGEWLLDMLADGPVTLSVQTQHFTDLQSVNVIGTRPATVGDADTAPIVYLSAHLDSVPGSPGANDSASSVALALETARVLASFDTGDMEIRVGLWGAEEIGLVGSRHHVNALSSDEISRILGVFHTDMVGTSSPRATNLYVFTLDGQSNPIVEAVLAAADRLGVNVPFGRFTGQSDHASFNNRGVPNIVMSWMRIDSFNPLVWELEPFYHTPEDSYDLNIDPERLKIALDVFGSAVLDFVLPAPELIVTEPADGLVTVNSAVWVQGTATDPNGIAAVTVNGEPALLGPNGAFALPVALQEGDNEITVAAVNGAGKVTTVTRTVRADWTAPVLTDIEPSSDVAVEQGDSLTVRFHSEPGLTASFVVTVPGQMAMASMLGNPLAEVSPGVYEGSYTVPPQALFDKAEIWITAVDAAGHATIVAAPGRLTAIPFVPPPQLEIAEPVAGLRTDRDVIRVSGAAYDDSGIVAVTVNGRKVTVRDDGTFATNVVLHEGVNDVTVVALAATGKQSVQVIPVTAVWSAPVIADMEPAGDVTVASGESIVLRFTAAPDLQAAYQVLVNGVPGSFSGRGSPAGTPMTEVSPGVYEATYTAPANTVLTGALIRFNVADEFGHLAMVTAPGRLNVRMAELVH